MSTYQLGFSFKSNERPWSGSLDGRRIESDVEAVEWARYFEDKIGADYVITLFKDGETLSHHE